MRAANGEPYQPIRIVSFAPAGNAWQSLTNHPPFVELRLIPRSNFLEQTARLPLNQGRRGWDWTGHMAWTDEQLPARPLYSQRVSKRGNFEWTLNQARYALEATAMPGQLRVHLETVTPGFDTFTATIDGEPVSVQNEFIWTLQPGRNRLAVWPRNIAGRDGIASTVVIEYRPQGE